MQRTRRPSNAFQGCVSAHDVIHHQLTPGAPSVPETSCVPSLCFLPALIYICKYLPFKNNFRICPFCPIFRQTTKETQPGSTSLSLPHHFLIHSHQKLLSLRAGDQSSARCDVSVTLDIADVPFRHSHTSSGASHLFPPARLVAFLLFLFITYYSSVCLLHNY